MCMNANIIPSIVISVFLILIVLGFVVGWVRGFSKSIIRFIIVLGVGVLAFFVIPSITNAILTLDISKYNIVIGEVQVITIQDLVTDLLRQMPFIEDILNASPTFETFLEIFPSLIANVILFVLFFFIFKWVSMIIYWIIAGIFFSKKKTEGKEKHGFIGALIGALQGFVVACIVLIPCFGLVATAEPVVEALASESAETGEEAITDGQTESNFVDGVYYVDGEDLSGSESGETAEDTSGSDSLSTSQESIADTVRRIERYTDAFKDNWVYKMLDAIGIRKLSVSMFDNLSTVTENDVEFNLRREVTVFAKAYPDIQVIMDTGFNIEDNNTLNALKNTVNTLYESNALSNMVGELLPNVSVIWLNGATFCEIPKPTFDDASVQDLFDTLLRNISVSSSNSIKNDILTGVDLLIITNDAGLLHTVLNDGDIMEILRNPENNNLISSIIGKALESETLKSVLPKVINVAMEYVYRGLDIDPSTINKIDVDSTTIDWTFETPRLQVIFNNVFKIYDQIETGTEAGQSALENLDFALLGETFDNIRFSTLLGPSSKQIMNALLNSQAIVGTGNEIIQSFVTELNNIWDDKTVSLQSTFISIGEAISLAKDLQTSMDDFNVDSLENILTSFTENETLKNVVNEVVKEETLTGLGLDEQTAGLVSETILAVINTDYSEGSGNSLANEIDAVKEIYSVANKVLNTDTSQGSTKVEVASEDATSLVNALANSTVLLDTITNAGSSVGDLGISEALSEEAKLNIEDAISNLDTSVYGEETIEKLNSLFGTLA